ncbi:hypothetical protein HNO89_003919 [Sporosarcina luteola]|nr:hypothetical protein [Sporosarcina luteola]
MLKNRKKTFCLLITIFIVLLSGCNGMGKAVDHYFLSLQGESQTWELSGYEMVITPKDFKAGNGVLKTKNKGEFLSNFFQFETHIIIDGEDLTVHSGSVSFSGLNEEEGLDISNEMTGAIEGESYLNKNGNPISFKEISDIYVIVEWSDMKKGEYTKEKIELYSRTNQEPSFLN